MTRSARKVPIARWSVLLGAVFGPGCAVVQVSAATKTIKVRWHGLRHFSSLARSGSTAYLSTLSGITAINGA